MKSYKSCLPITTIAEIGKHDGQTVTIRGWLYNLRESGKLLFPQFRDGSGMIQGVVPKNAVPPEVFDAIKGLTQESSVIVEGKVRADKRAPGGYELDVANVQVVQRVPESDPLSHYSQRPRRRLSDGASPSLGAFAAAGGDPASAGGDHQGGARLLRRTRIYPDRSSHHHSGRVRGHDTLFPVDYFDEQAFLTQSGQLYIEATAMALGKVYSFGPTFRAEKSKTRRHLTEFWMVEPEVAYAELDDVMELAEGLISFIVKRCLEKRRPTCRPLAATFRSLKRSKRPFRASPTTKR